MARVGTLGVANHVINVLYSFERGTELACKFISGVKNILRFQVKIRTQ